MNNTAIQPASGPDAQLMERVLLGGDLASLTPGQRVEYYRRTCESLGLNPLTKPFGYITLNGKLTLYALKDAAEQLRTLRKVSITQLEKQFTDDLYIVTAHAQTADGRTDASTGAVTIGTLKGDAKANAIMKAETKAKRRVTLSICGLGFLDESEVSSIPDARPVVVTEEGAIAAAPKVEEWPESTFNQATPDEPNEKPDREMIVPMGKWAVEYAAEQWHIKPSEAAHRIAGLKLGSLMEKGEFTDIVSKPPAE